MGLAPFFSLNAAVVAPVGIVVTGQVPLLFVIRALVRVSIVAY